MNATRKLGVIAVALASLAVAGDGNAVSAAQAKLWVSGTSSVQPWKCAAKSVDARITGLPEEGLTLATITSASGATARIDVASLDCSNDTMNEHLRNALKAKDHPQVRFEVKSYQLGAAQGGKARLALEGVLTLGGVTRPIHVDATATELPGGTVGVAGQYALTMTDFGLKPPELFFGAMKVDPKVVVGFELKISAAAASAPIAAGQR
jgi:polyisoprenoid-binding protein YceI